MNMTLPLIRKLEKAKNRLKLISLFPKRVYFTKPVLHLLEHDKLDPDMFDVLTGFDQCLSSIATNSNCPSHILEQISMRSDISEHTAEKAFRTRCAQKIALSPSYITEILKNDSLAKEAVSNKMVSVAFVLERINLIPTDELKQHRSILEFVLRRPDLSAEDFINVFNKYICVL